MTTLSFLAPERWPNELDDLVVEWVRHDEKRKEIIDHGFAPFSQLPEADRCELIAPAPVSLHLSVEAPTQNRRKFMDALPYVVEERLITKPEETYTITGPIGAEGATPIIALDRRWLATAQNYLGATGRSLDAMRFESLLIPWREEECTLHVSQRGSFIRTTLFDALSLDQPLNGGPPRVVEMTGEENIRLYRGSGLIDSEMDRWDLSEPYRVTDAGEWEWRQGVVQDHHPKMTTLHKEFHPPGKVVRALPHLKKPLLLVGLIFFIWFVSLGVEIMLLQGEMTNIKSEMTTILTDTFPRITKVVNAPHQMRTEMERLRESSAGRQKELFLTLLAASAKPLADAEIILHSIDYKNRSLTLRLSAVSDEAMEKATEAIDAAGMRSTLTKQGDEYLVVIRER